MNKKMIIIDQDKCIGCGICAKTCKQSAIEMVDGKAMVVRKDYCDGIGNCLPVCPVGAITFSDQDVQEQSTSTSPSPSGCPGSNSVTLTPAQQAHTPQQPSPSQLNQWPVQIKLAPTNGTYFNHAHLLIAADCSAYAYGNFHGDFMKHKVTLIGCPKLDEGDYTEKLTTIIRENEIKSVTVTRMEVPCCGGLERAVVNALKNSGKFIPWQIVTITTNGSILET